MVSENGLSGRDNISTYNPFDTQNLLFCNHNAGEWPVYSSKTIAHIHATGNSPKPIALVTELVERA